MCCMWNSEERVCCMWQAVKCMASNRELFVLWPNAAMRDWADILGFLMGALNVVFTSRKMKQISQYSGST